jgi:ribosomal protein S18 acetylase RimI-like enzyme
MPSFRLRPEKPEDAELLYALYASTREAEMARLPWNAREKEVFLRQQFAAQSAHYRTYHPEASFDIIVRAGEAVGRLYVDRQERMIHILDLTLLPSARGQGVGSMLLKELTEEGKETGVPTRIYVEGNNPAMNLCLRLGFVNISQEGVYCLMEKRP